MNQIRRNWFSLSAGLICFIWAFIGWLTVIPNQDILADGIQAQSLLTDPRIVLAFPGQKHAGPLEYPFTVLAEWLAPGNYFANAAVRPLLAFITGFLVAKLFLTLFPKATKWAFLVAIAVGPSIIHGMLGPAGNTVGVWWLQPNWDMAWLFVTLGALLIARSFQSENRKWIIPAIGGLSIGLGFYAHPAISLLIVPLLVLVALRITPNFKVMIVAAVGAAIGIMPAAASYVVNAKVNTWDPSHGAFLSIEYFRSMGGAVLGLTGIPDYMLALLPYGMGLTPSHEFLSGSMQSVLMWVFVLGISIVSAIGLIRAIRTKSAVSAATAVALAWVASIATMMVFIVFVDPVWIYSSGLAVLLWLSLGAMPTLINPRWLGNTATVVAIAIIGVSTLTHNSSYFTNIPSLMSQKIDTQSSQQALAQELKHKGANYVFGSYYDVIPVGYASGHELRTVTNHYNRFPLSPGEEQSTKLTVAVNLHPTDTWGDEALATVNNLCKPVPDLASKQTSPYGIFSCPGSALVFHK